MENKGFGVVGIIIAIAVLAVIGGGFYFLQNSANLINNSQNEEIGQIARTDIKDNSIEVVGSDRKIIDTLVLEGISQATDLFSETSPNKMFVFYGWSRGDGGRGWIYDVRDGQSYEINFGISTIKPSRWLEDNKLDIYSGCVLATDCTHYRSVDSDMPWDLREGQADFEITNMEDNMKLSIGDALLMGWNYNIINKSPIAMFLVSPSGEELGIIASGADTEKRIGPVYYTGENVQWSVGLYWECRDLSRCPVTNAPPGDGYTIDVKFEGKDFITPTGYISKPFNIVE